MRHVYFRHEFHKNVKICRATMIYLTVILNKSTNRLCTTALMYSLRQSLWGRLYSVHGIQTRYERHCSCWPHCKYLLLLTVNINTNFEDENKCLLRIANRINLQQQWMLYKLVHVTFSNMHISNNIV